ncbi:MAG: [FeFe] hydrogenase H-cluster radical SAM maturase HydG [Eubacteriales bacterium]|nr:[FeFe] hydrogenase H-cluster radical SAM maturase HydG [Eubacteriales bacterium]MDY3332427.1 [FeFe] hydrogenase H-cluster radical SAM maturase HydG [Gallibacter sp.]
MYKYDIKSSKAEEFINHEHIIKCIKEAEADKGIDFYMAIVDKAREEKGLSHMEVAYLLHCKYEEVWQEIFKLAKQIKEDYYGSRIVLFAPLYLSNYCINGCVYCPYHATNTTIPRKKLTQEEIKREAIALMDMGHKRLALEMGEDDTVNTMEYLLDSIKTIYDIKHKNGEIRRVNVNIAATTVENYTKLRDAGIGTYILFQETYHKENYEKLHPTGPKSDYAWHTEAMDRAMEGGIDDVGCGVLFGLNNYIYDFIGIIMHAEHLEARFGVGPHTISIPRICPADDINPEEFENSLSDELFLKIVALLRIAVPYTGLIVSTRESQKSREKALQYGISQISGGSKTSVGGYACDVEDDFAYEESVQFDISDKRTLDDIVKWLLEQGHMPSFCTACYREGRTGDRFMSLCKSKQICNVCLPNALMTLNEYLEDYASEETKALGEQKIMEELEHIKQPKVKEKAREYIKGIKDGKRDFRF